MRHRKKINHLGRKAEHRVAMLTNLANSLIFHKRIKTTIAKAKALRVFIEPLITRAKSNTTHSRRMVFSYLKNKKSVTELFRNIASKVSDRPGGYTRILKLETRKGDNAEMCYIELVDFNENMLKTIEEKPKTKRRRKRKKSPKTSEPDHTQETTQSPKKQTPKTTEQINEDTPDQKPGSENIQKEQKPEDKKQT